MFYACKEFALKKYKVKKILVLWFHNSMVLQSLTFNPKPLVRSEKPIMLKLSVMSK